jgi:hypothetical protein
VEVRRGGVWTNRFDAAQVSLARRESDFENDLTDGSVTALLLLSDVRLGDVVRVAFSVEGKIRWSPTARSTLSISDGPIPCWNGMSGWLHPAQARIDVRRFGTGRRWSAAPRATGRKWS